MHLLASSTAATSINTTFCVITHLRIAILAAITMRASLASPLSQ